MKLPKYAPHLLIAGAGALVVFVLYRKAKTLVTETLNPASDRNIVYDGIVGNAGRAVSGNQHWTLGGWVYEIFNDDFDPNKK